MPNLSTRRRNCYPPTMELFCNNDVSVDVHSPKHKWPSQMEDFMQLWDNLMNSLEQANLEWAAITMTNIWLRKKYYVFNNRYTSPLSW